MFNCVDLIGFNIQEILKFLRDQYLLQLRESGGVLVEGMQLAFKIKVTCNCSGKQISSKTHEHAIGGVDYM